MADTIDLRLIFPLQFTPASIRFGPRVELKLQLPRESTRQEPVRRLMTSDPSGLTGREWHIEFAGLANVQLTLHNGQIAGSLKRKIELEFQAGIGDPLRFTIPNPDTSTNPLLYGSIVIDRSSLPDAANLRFRTVLGSCWPTGALQEIEQYRFEPSGFYLVGEIPQGLIDEPPIGGQNKSKHWALRVPQPMPAPSPQKTAIVGQPLPLDPRRWVLTSEEFLKNGVPLLNATSFIESIARGFREFKLNDGRTMIDNVESNPEPQCTVELRRTGQNSIKWHATGIGTRVVIGGVEAGESQFDPDQLLGNIRRAGNNWRHDETTLASSTEFDPAEKHVEIALKRDENPSKDTVELTFPAEVGAMTATNVPAVTTEKANAAGFPLVASTTTIERAWMCISNGWLGVDADSTSATLAPGSTRPGPLGLIEVDRLMKALDLGAHQTGFERGISLKVLPVHGKHVGLSLLGAKRDLLRLRVSQPIALLTLPPFFYVQPPGQPITGDDGATAARSRSWVPSLASRLEQSSLDGDSGTTTPQPRRGQLNDPEIVLRQILATSEWVSTGAVNSTSVKMTSTDLGNPSGVTWKVDRLLGYRTFFDAKNDNVSFSRVVIRHRDMPDQWCIADAADGINTDGVITFSSIAEKSPSFPSGGFSTGIKEIYLTDVSQLRAEVSWDKTLGFKMRLPASKDRAILWMQPVHMPLVCTFSRPGSDTPTVVMDDQRGQIPFELKSDSTLEVSFPADSLPKVPSTEIDLGNIQSNIWRAISNHELLMLPTLPGAESEIKDDELKWRLRHAVPVLDEAYLEVRESTQATDEPLPRTTLDITRVEGTVACDIVTTGASTAGNWLPGGSSATANSVLIKSFTPTGTRPELTIQLANGADVTFSRRHELNIRPATDNVDSAGLTQGLSVAITPSAAGNLPAFDVAFTTGSADAEIRRDGQPLLARLDSKHAIVALDGLGTVRGEPTTARTRFRPHSEANDRIRHTASFRGDGLQLDLIGMEIGKFTETYHHDSQQWMLHDGKGVWGLLHGFALYPIDIAISTQFKAELTAVLLPIETVKQQLRGLAAEVLKKQLPRLPTAVVSLQITTQNGELKIDSFTGAFQWRFEDEEKTNRDGITLTGVSGRVERKLGQTTTVAIDELVLSSEFGIVRLFGLDLPAKVDEPAIGAARLIVPEFEFSLPGSPSGPGPVVHVGEFSIASDNKHPISLADCSVTWKLGADSNGGNKPLIEYTLIHSPSQPEPWTLLVSVADPGGSGSGEVNISYALKATQVDARQYLFVASSDQTALPQIPGAFPLKSTSGIMTAQFNRLTQLTQFGGDLLFGFASKVSGVGDGILFGRLSVGENGPSGGAPSATPLIETSGTIAVRNGIESRSADDQEPVEHIVTFFFDFAHMPFPALLQGRHSGSPVELSCVARHQLLHDGETLAEWQVPQNLRWMSLGEFKSVYAPSENSLQGAPDSCAVIEAGTVVWVASDTTEIVTPHSEGRLSDIERPDAGSGFHIAIEIRSTSEIEVDKPGHVVRLPFAACNSLTAPLHIITVDERTGGMGCTSRGAQHQPLYLPSAPRAPQVAYLSRSSQAANLDASALRGYLRPLDRESMRSAPAFPVTEESLESTNHLPTLLGDLTPFLKAQGAGSVVHLAATIVRRHPLQPDTKFLKWWEQHGQLLAGAVIYQLPLHLRIPEVATARPIVAQLVSVSNGRFHPLAQKIFDPSSPPSDTALRQWAQEILDAKPRGIVAFILKNYSACLPVPSSYEQHRERIPDAWYFAPVETDRMLDPRVRIPGPSVGPNQSSNERLEALSDRTLYAFQADIPVTEDTDRPVIAATHVRLAAIHGGEKTKGKLRSATLSTVRTKTSDSGLGPQLSWSQRDAVNYQAAATAGYPKLDGMALSNLPFATVARKYCTLMPPLMHAVVWASRPGEMARTMWSYEEYSDNKNTDELVCRSGLSSIVELRRPRAQAGRFESVRLVPPNEGEATRRVFGQRLTWINLDLEQTLGISPPPRDRGINAVLSTRETFFISHQQLDIAKVEPALIYQTAPPTPELEPLRLTLFADPRFDPDAIPNPPDSDLQTETYLFLFEKGATIPDKYPLGNPPISATKFVVVDLDGRGQTRIPPLTDGTFWKPRPDLTNQLCFSATIEEFDQQTKGLNGDQLDVRLVRYVLDKSDGHFKEAEGELFAFSLTRLNRSAAFLLPKMSVSLLGVGASSGPAHLAGYGRLNASDFSLPVAQVVPIGNSSTIPSIQIRWVRFARLTALDRHDGAKFDVVVYGPGGELIPTRNGG